MRIRNALKIKLSPLAAWNAAITYGKSKYSHGFTLQRYPEHLMAITPKDADTWSIMGESMVKDTAEDKAEKKTCIFEITGTTDNPQVISLAFY